MTTFAFSLSAHPFSSWSVLVFATAMVISFVLTPVAKRTAFRFGAVDQPGGRKIHRTPTARFGGIAVVGGLAIGLAALATLDPTDFGGAWQSPLRAAALGLGMAIVFLVGVRDDVRGVSPGVKLTFQLSAALVSYAAGFSFFHGLSVTGISGVVLHGADCLLTVVWVVGVTNAVNLVDGLDGLASGVGIIACIAIIPFGIWNQDGGTMLLTLSLAGALLGFLYHNFNPAGIFLGDSGSLVVGFLLAILTIRCATPVTNGVLGFVPLLIVGLPVADTLFAVTRRLLRALTTGRSSKQPVCKQLKLVFSPDKSHIHHRLVDAGLSQRSAVLLLYAVCCISGGSAVVLARSGQENVWPLVLVCLLATAIFIVLAATGNPLSALIHRPSPRDRMNTVPLQPNESADTHRRTIAATTVRFRRMLI